MNQTSTSQVVNGFTVNSDGSTSAIHSMSINPGLLLRAGGSLTVDGLFGMTCSGPVRRFIRQLEHRRSCSGDAVGFSGHATRFECGYSHPWSELAILGRSGRERRALAGRDGQFRLRPAFDQRLTEAAGEYHGVRSLRCRAEHVPGGARQRILQRARVPGVRARFRSG